MGRVEKAVVRGVGEVGVISWIIDRDLFALDGSNSSFVVTLKVWEPYSEDRANLNVSMDWRNCSAYWEPQQRRLL